MEDPPENNPKQAESTIQKVKGLNKDELLKWIEGKRPGQLEGDSLETFKEAAIPGLIFLKHAGDETYFHERCGLRIGPSELLADLASEIIERDKTNREGKYSLSYHGHHLDSQLTMPQGEERGTSTGKHANRVQN
jgi:hypothetical protein